jgi:hypothetical protein
MMDQLVEAAANVGKSPSHEHYTMLCYARKWMAEHLELLCAEAGVGPADDDQTLRFL